MDLNIEKVWELFQGLVKEAANLLPGKTGKEKKAYVTEKAVALLEMGDNFLPVIGQWADLPVIDGFERYLVGIAIERAYAALNLPE